MQLLNRFYLKYWQIALIIIAGSVLRFYNLSNVPPSLNWDEVSHGYNAFSILKTGKDEWGVNLPTIFRAFGDYKLPVYIYLTSLTELLFGLSELSVRLVSALAGVSTIIFTYLLTEKLFSKKPAVLAGLLVAVEPWTLFLSRGAFEANLALTLIISGTYFFLQAKTKPKQIVISFVLFGLSVWTYNSARMFVPLQIILLYLLFKPFNVRKPTKTAVVAALILFIFFLPMFWQLATGEGQARYSKVAILDQGAIAKIEAARSSSKLSPEISHVLHNKYTYFAQEFMGNWVKHFSPDFLFLKGGSNYQFNIPSYGLLYPVNALLLLLGLLFLVRKRDKASLLLLGWLIISPIASSITREAPHTLRSITILPIPMVISAIGGVGVWELLRRHKVHKAGIYTLLVLYTILLAGNTEDYLTRYFTNYQNNYSWSWQYGYKEAVRYAKEHYSEYDQIIITKKYGEPHEFLLFYWPWDPEEYRTDPNLVRFYQSDWYWVDRFDKFYFVNDWQIPKDSNAEFKMESGGMVPVTDKTLLITSPGNNPRGWKILKTIRFLDNEPAFDIVKKT